MICLSLVYTMGSHRIIIGNNYNGFFLRRENACCFYDVYAILPFVIVNKKKGLSCNERKLF